MRYIGSKTNLLGEIAKVVNRLSGNVSNITDLFAGTGSVGEHFKPTHKIVSNDLLYFCYVLNAAKLANNAEPRFEELSKILGSQPLDFLNNLNPLVSDADGKDFAYLEYSPAGPAGRNYLSPSNALKVDRIRQTIEQWSQTDLISEAEKNYLIASLIDAVPSYSNIAGTYGAFLKHWDARALKELRLQPIKIAEGKFANQVFNEDSNSLIKRLSGDVLYLDTPYNGRQYSSNYHLLETVARYDYPLLRGKTGTRQDESGKSQYCSKVSVRSAFRSLFEDADFKHILVSYSSEGLLAEEELVELLVEFGNEASLILERIPYRRYKRLANDEREHVMEYLLAVSR